MKWILQFLLLAPAAALLMSCNTIRTYEPSEPSEPSYQYSAQEYQQIADNSTGSQKQQSLLFAAQQHMQDKNIEAAQQTLADITKSSLSPIQQVKKLILEAQIKLHNKQPQQALALLTKVQTDQSLVDPETSLKFQQLLARAYFANNNILSALNSSTIAASLLGKKQEKQKYLVHVWQKLQYLNTNTLKSLENTADNSTQLGWLSLALITNSTNNAHQLLDKIKLWQIQYFNHPAQVLVSSIQHRQIILPRLPSHITLLLPLNGTLANQGRAIRNGFLAAFYQGKSQGYSPEINVLDTSQDNITKLYVKAVQGGANLIVGPLLKSNIEQLISNQQLSVPVIALNTIPSSQSVINLYQFGLSPDDEATQVAEKIAKDHHQHILLITPDNAWGQRIKTAFENTWQRLGGKITGQLAYQARAKLAHQLRHLLNLDQSHHRSLEMRWLLKEKLRYIPRRRHDFDAIFLVATPSMGRQILPLLRFYYTSNVPIYSISEIYQGYAHQKKDHDLNGVIFDDIPWLFADSKKLPKKINDIRDNAKSAWPKSFKRYSRLYALGTDAFNLIPELDKLSLLPHFGMIGATGTLYLQSNGQIFRELIWAQMKDGKPDLL